MRSGRFSRPDWSNVLSDDFASELHIKKRKNVLNAIVILPAQWKFKTCAVLSLNSGLFHTSQFRLSNATFQKSLKYGFCRKSLFSSIWGTFLTNTGTPNWGKKCSTGQRFIRKEETYYKIHTLVYFRFASRVPINTCPT